MYLFQEAATAIKMVIENNADGTNMTRRKSHIVMISFVDDESFNVIIWFNNQIFVDLNF